MHSRTAIVAITGALALLACVAWYLSTRPRRDEPTPQPSKPTADAATIAAELDRPNVQSERASAANAASAVLPVANDARDAPADVPATGKIRGRLVDESGRPPAGEWSARADMRGADGTDIRIPFAYVNPANGRFFFPEVPVGQVFVSATANLDTRAAPHAVDVHAGETADIELVYTGPDLARRIVVSTSCARPMVLCGPLDGVTLRGLDGDRTARAEADDRTYVFDDVTPGTYTASIDDPKFQPWSQDDVAPGALVRVELRGSAAVRLLVVDADTARPITSYETSLRYDNVRFQPNVVELPAHDDVSTHAQLFEGLAPGDQTLVVRVAGKLDCFVPVPALAAREVRTVTARVGSGTSIDGHVLEADGHSPAAGAEVVLVPLDYNERDAVIADDTKQQRVVIADADGRFRFDGLPNDRGQLRAQRGPFVWTGWQTVDPALSSTTRALTLVLPAWGRVHGRIRRAAGDELDTAHVRMRPTADSEAKRAIFDWIHFRVRERATSQIAADGSYRSIELPAGVAAASLAWPDTVVATRDGSMGTKGAEISLGEVSVIAGEDRQHDFENELALPGRLIVRLLGAESERASWGVRASSIERSVGGNGLGFANAAGEVHMPLLPPGDYRITIEPDDASWQFIEPRIVRVSAQAVATIEVQVRLFEGVVTLRDASGALGTSRSVTVTEAVPAVRPFESRSFTNERGELRLRRPAGPIRMRWTPTTRTFGPAGAVAIEDAGIECEWTPSGPVPATLTLPAK